MAPSYAEAAVLKKRFAISDTEDETLVYNALEGASRGIDKHCRRVFFTTSTTLTFVADDPYCLIPADTDVWAGDIISVTSLSTDDEGDGVFETAWAATDYQLWPVNAAMGPEVRPYTEVRAVGAKTFPLPDLRNQRANRVQIVGTFGWPDAVPPAVREACLIVAGELFKMKDAPFGVAGFGDFGAVRVRENPIASKLLEDYRRDSVLVA